MQAKQLSLNSAALWLLLAALTLTLLASPVRGQEEEAAAEGEEGAPPPPKAMYIPLKPAFVVNYGGKGKLKYIKVDMSIRVNDSVSAYGVRHHMPLIRNDLVLLFSSQEDADIDTQAGKELLRQAALEKVQQILKDEEAGEGVVDLYFNNFVVQR